jgi:hypothetical protein
MNLDKFEYYNLDKKPNTIDFRLSSIKELEKELETTLPKDYKAYLQSFDVIGFHKKLKVFVVEKNPLTEFTYLEILYGFSERNIYNLFTLIFDTYSGRIPDETIPIGQDAYGNLFLLSVYGDNFGKIWFWDHEHREIAESKFKEMVKDLKNANIATKGLDIESIIWQWERLPNNKLMKNIGFGNVYLLANSFTEFIQNITVENDA